MPETVINVVVAGLGGQGVIKASDILADVAFRAGIDVKKAEIHGMSQRGGSVSTDVRFGPKVLSPMIPAGEADFLVVLSPDQVDNNRWVLRPHGRLISAQQITEQDLPNRKSLNIALLGVLSSQLKFPETLWHAAIAANLPDRLLEMNMQAFAIGRRIGASSPAMQQAMPS